MRSAIDELYRRIDNQRMMIRELKQENDQLIVRLWLRVENHLTSKMHEYAAKLER